MLLFRRPETKIILIEKAPMRKAERLFQLTNLIRSKQPVTAERMAEELGLSIRSIYRYIDDLSISGIPIYGTPGIGYRLDKNFELPPLNLTDLEFDALTIGVGMVTSWTGDELSLAAKSLANKIEASLPAKQRGNFSSVVFAPDIQPYGLDKKQLRNKWETLHKAIRKDHQVEMQYLSLDEQQSTRCVYPLGFFYWGAKWTLGAWCTKREDYRSFRIDRIQSMSIRAASFEKSNKINLKNYIEHASGQASKF
ncbi:MAG: YafY family transcriptional regulator [Kangiellaceae bacterium]|nr:YafY family transcriptional regulator [Kangiellaceae bacterium]